MHRISIFLILLAAHVSADTSNPFRNLDPAVLSEAQRKEARGMIEHDIRRRSRAVNARSIAEWQSIDTRQKWEAYRDKRLAVMQRALGLQKLENPLRIRETGSWSGPGFIIRNLLFESRPGDWVTANLYVPEKAPRGDMPGILIAHSHHVDRMHGELQDMGMTWARAGCAVLVIDQVGYGERRSHAFHRDADYAKPFKRSRQDYYHRYDTGVQLQLIGESLMGWMVQDLMRGVDVVLGLDGIDPEKIILLGGVAGGGDPCGVTAALDKRIAAAVPFNFGGPQPETRYPLPEDAATSFDYLYGSYWDSTRGLYRSGADGFLHYLIVGGIAPRRLVYAHEFSWDRERDPVWKRLEHIWGAFYDKLERLAFAHGHGLLRGPSAEASHCTVIGRTHRAMIHPHFKRWFGIEAVEFSGRVNREILAARDDGPFTSFTELVRKRGAATFRLAELRFLGMDADERLSGLRNQWAAVLGPVEARKVILLQNAKDRPVKEELTVERIVLETDPGIRVPVLLLRPNQKGPLPVVIGLSSLGKKSMLVFRGAEIRKHLAEGRAVVLPDVRGTGETRGGDSRGRTSGDTNRSVNLQLFGETLLGQRLRDLRGVLVYLRGRSDLDPHHIRLWGESLVEANPPDTDFKIPHGVSGRPRQPEPLGGLLALLGVLFDERIEQADIRGGLVSYASALKSPHLYLPHDACVPGAITIGDIPLLVQALGDRVTLREPVDALNRRK